MSACEICASSAMRALFASFGGRIERCAGCGLERLSPQPSDATLAASYGAPYYDAWGLRRDARAVAALKARTFRRVLGTLGRPGPDAKLLDCGAATGHLLEVAASLGYEPYGVELSTFGARALAARFGEARVFHGTIDEARFEGAADGDFSVVTMCDLLEHVRDPRRTLERARGLLARDGALVITTPDTASLSRRASGRHWSHYRPEHLFYFDAANLTRLCREAGFPSVSFHPLRKVLSLDYVACQLDANPRPLITPLLRALRRLTPARLRATPLSLPTGELFAIARPR